MTATLEPSAPSIRAAHIDAVTRFHLSLNVANLDAAIGFYRILMGRSAGKVLSGLCEI